MSSRYTQECTDKELESTILLLDMELRKDKNDLVIRKKDLSINEINQLQKAIIQKEKWLNRLLNKRKCRLEYDKENIV
jgi:hypothetical protein